MAAVAKLYATLGLDTSGFDKGVKKSQTNMQKFQGAVLSGVGFGAGLSVWTQVERGVKLVTDGIGDAITAASNMTETQTKLDQVFMTSADTMRDWAEGSAQSMIMSEQAALASAATFGNFLQALGVAEDTSASMSQQLVQLSADLASYNNLAGGAEEATMRLFSGMSGEMEAVRRLGIDLSETAVTAYLLEHGVKRVGMQFKQSDKTMARFALIMKDTAKAQGDVARTSMNLANRQREFNAEIGNLQAALGAALVGPMADFTGWLADVARYFAGPDALDKRFDAFIEKLGLMDDAVAEMRQKAGNSAEAAGLGWLEEFYTLPGVAAVFPGLDESIRLWEKNFITLREGGFTYSDFANKLALLKEDFHLTTEAAMEQILAFNDLEYAVKRVAGIEAKMAREDAFAFPFVPEDRLTPFLDSIQTFYDGVEAAGTDFDWSMMYEGIDKAFAEWRQSIKSGFGSVKAALADGDQIIAPETRMANMRSRLSAATAYLARARQVGDPWAIAKGQAMVNKQRLNLHDYEVLVRKTRRGVGTTLDGMSGDASDAFGDMRRNTRRKANGAADDAIGAAKRTRRGVKDALTGIDSMAWGVALMTNYALGIASQRKAVGQAVGRVAQGVMNQLRVGSPAKEGPLSKGGGPGVWGENVSKSFGAGMGKYKVDLDAMMSPRHHRMPAMVMAGAGDGGITVHIGKVYGGPAGLRELSAAIERAIRPTRRERRRNRLAEG